MFLKKTHAEINTLSIQRNVHENVQKETYLNSHTSWQQTSQPRLPSLESIHPHTFSFSPTQLICHVCNSLFSVDCSSFCFAVPPFSLSACFPLILSQPRGLPAITPPVHQHRGQEGGIYADIWTVIPTIHAVCQCTAGSSLQHAHTPVPKLRTLQPYGQEIRLTSQ